MELKETRTLLGQVLDRFNELEKGKDLNPSQRLSRNEVMNEYGISNNLLHKLMKEGLSFEKIGRRTVFKRADIEKYFDNQKRSL